MGFAWRAMDAWVRTRGHRHGRAYFYPHATRRPAAVVPMFAWPLAKWRQLQHDHATMLRMLRVMAYSAHPASVHDMLGPGRSHMHACGAT